MCATQAPRLRLRDPGKVPTDIVECQPLAIIVPQARNPVGNIVDRPPGNFFNAPDDIWAVNRRLRLDEPLDGERDPRWVDTKDARGSYKLHQLYRALGVDMHKSGRTLREPEEQGYFLFCGHRGSGKSTELRRIRDDLDSPDAYYVVFADAAQELDVNNLRYQDILLHLAGKLVERLGTDGIDVDRVHLGRLEEWFTERVEKQERTREFALQVRSGARIDGGLPFVGKLFADISNVFKTNSTYKEELRRTLQNYFTDFAEAFNHLIEAATESVRAAGKGNQILFVIDGTDLLRGDDAQAFFVEDIYQLKQVRGLFIYCAPIHLIYEGSAAGQNFDLVFSLPMIKVANPDGSRNETGCDAMREILHRRADPDLFDPGVVDYLIDQSGGHPRDLLRLLQTAFRHAEDDRFDDASAQAAVREAATEFRRILDSEDYALLARTDSFPDTPPHSDRARGLLYNLALLEYNDFYWRSHPVIRTTDAYRAAQQAVGNAGNG